MKTGQINRSALDVPVFFATTEGQTQRIAERLAAELRRRGFSSLAIDVAGSADVDWTLVRGAIVGASLHMQQHQADAAAFVRRHAGDLNRVPSAFFSVSLSAGSRSRDEVAAAQHIAAQLPAAHGWNPSLVVCLAGRLAYTQYGLVKRLLMKRIAKKEGGPTDTSRDHELTDWLEVDRLAATLAGMIRDRGDARGGPPAA